MADLDLVIEGVERGVLALIDHRPLTSMPFRDTIASLNPRSFFLLEAYEIKGLSDPIFFEMVRSQLQMGACLSKERARWFTPTRGSASERVIG